MEYKIIGISFSDFQLIHSYYHPRTIITSSWYNKTTELYDLTITDHAIIKINNGGITFDLGGKLLTIPYGNYYSLTIS